MPPGAGSTGPRILITVASTASQPDAAIAARKNDLYAASVARHGAIPVVVDESTSPAERAAAFASMDGLLLSGGADLAPSRYGRENKGSTAVQPARDSL